MCHKRVLFILFSLSYFLCRQFKNGRSYDVPEFSCDNMTPINTSNNFRNIITPYTISTDHDCLTVIIQGNDVFQKFIIKAFDSFNQTVGKFVLNDKRTEITCEETAVTHSIILDITQIGLRWDANGYIGKVHFVATVMKDDLYFWRVSSASCDIRPTINTREFEAQKSCSQTSGCFQCPDNNCVITWSNVDNIYVDFQVSGYVRSDNRYLAIAFFYDDRMGNGSVVICKKEINYYVQLWFEIASTIIAIDNPLESLKPNGTSGCHMDNWMSCRFSKQIKRGPGSSDKVFYLDEFKYKIFFATGLMSINKTLIHERKELSTMMFNFTDLGINSVTVANVSQWHKN